MRGIKTCAANLANRINQQHHLEIELAKIFVAGRKSKDIEAKQIIIEFIKYAKKRNVFPILDSYIKPLVNDFIENKNIIDDKK